MEQNLSGYFMIESRKNLHSGRRRRGRGRRRRGRLLALAGMLVILLAVFGYASQQGDDANLTPGGRVSLEPLVRSTGKQVSQVTTLFHSAAIYRPAVRFAATLQENQKLGKLQIPQIGISEWLVQGTSKEALTLGAGHIEQTTIPGMGGNFGVAGDRVLYSAPLLRANQLAIGDEIKVEMPYGSFTYQVDGITNVDPENVGVLRPKGYDSITMSTCDPPWQITTRMIISAKLAHAEPRV